MIGRISAKQNKLQEAFCYYEKALQVKKDILDKNVLDDEKNNNEEKNNISNNASIAKTLEHLGYISCHQNKFQDAWKYYQESLTILGNIYGSTLTPILATKYDNLGRIAQLLGNYENAKIQYKTALELKLKLLYPHTKNNNNKKMDDNDQKHELSVNNASSVAFTIGCLGNLHRILGEYQQAEQHLKEQYIILQQIHGGNTNNIPGQQQKPPNKDIASVLTSLGNVYVNMGQWDAAVKHYRSSLQMKYALFGSDAQNDDIAGTLHR